MVNPANTLPVLPGSFNSTADRRLLVHHRRFEQQPALKQYGESGQHNRQQTVEYIFRGRIEEQLSTNTRVVKSVNQIIHPANQKAISRYIDTETVSVHRPDRQGRVLNIFI